jgi:hypothetical protein
MHAAVAVNVRGQKHADSNDLLAECSLPLGPWRQSVPAQVPSPPASAAPRALASGLGGSEGTSALESTRRPAKGRTKQPLRVGLEPELPARDDDGGAADLDPLDAIR